MIIENAKIVISELSQSCKNIMAATAGVSIPEALEKDSFLLENIYMNLIILVESYIRIGDAKKDYPSINWEEIGSYTNVITRPVNEIDKKLISSIVKTKIPTLSAKLDRLLG